MSSPPLEALFSIHRGGNLLIERDRVQLLEAVARHRSITKGAKEAGYSYKTAWSAVTALNNLMPRPAFILHIGGRSGGGAELTDDGRRVLDAFHRLEGQLNRAAATLSEPNPTYPADLFWGIGMRTSARNNFYCKVLSVSADALNVNVTLQLSEVERIAATITRYSMQDLGIEPGSAVVALVKASAVMLAPADGIPRLSAGNKIIGIIAARADDSLESEIVLALSGGKTMTSIITRESADTLELNIGDKTCAIFKPSSVILVSG